MLTLCPHCHQPLPQMREGVRLSPLKARIFDMVRRANCEGVTIEAINAICFDGCSTPANVRMHIHQINEALAGTGVQIRGKVEGMAGFYHIARANHADA